DPDKRPGRGLPRLSAVHRNRAATRKCNPGEWLTGRIRKRGPIDEQVVSIERVLGDLGLTDGRGTAVVGDLDLQLAGRSRARALRRAGTDDQGRRKRKSEG